MIRVLLLLCSLPPFNFAHAEDGNKNVVSSYGRRTVYSAYNRRRSDEFRGYSRSGTPAPGSYNRFRKSMSDIEANFLKSSRCNWVKSLDLEAPKTDDVIAYVVAGCKLESKHGSQNLGVCSGNIRCDTTLEGKSFSFFVEHAMCISTTYKCPSANTCLSDGGALADMRVSDLEGIKDGDGRVYDQNKNPSHD